MGALNLSAESTATEASEHCIDRKELVANQLTIQDKWVLLASLKTSKSDVKACLKRLIWLICM